MDSTLDLNMFDSLIASYNEESFVASEIEAHPINDDPIIFVDEEHGYVPNLPLLREDCYEILSNGGEVVLEIQKEIVKGKLFCYVSHTEQVQDKVVYFVTHLNKDNNVTNVFQVVTGPTIGNYDCSCRNFTRIGYLCRHIFCVFRVNRVVRIPDEYISKCWIKDVLPKRIFEIQYRYGVDNSPESLLMNEIFGLISNCVDSLRNDYDGLAVLANKIIRNKGCGKSRNCKKKRTEAVDVTEE
ncbi:hypothetical protein E3N88_38047 [Mikania micrantha]|uniref:SWIM-type domain-containing protein n=1 Tax=Mikania micrantha TaxID=192012 RepID=A0A5N6LT64_9ASTR|nr:hypothetical protein E3N88_38047 [Mikania micrantha]